MEIIKLIRQFEELQEEWNLLADKLKNPLLRHEWFLSCAKTFQAEDSLRIAIIRKNDRLTAAAPLRAVYTGGVERWEILGFSSLYEPCGFLYDNLTSLDVLLQSLFAQRIPLIFQRIESNSAAISAITNLPITKGLIIKRQSSPSLMLRLPATWKELLAARSSNFRYDLKRKQTRAMAEGLLSVECLPIKPYNLEEYKNNLFEVEGSGWKGIKGSSLKKNEKIGRFFIKYMRLAVVEGMLRIAFLKLNGQIIAVQLGVEAYRKYWVLKMGYDESYSHFSPGFLLTAEVIRDAIERGLEAYEFLGSAEPWEKRWGAQYQDFLAVLIYPPTVLGGVAFIGDGMKVIRRRTSSRIRQLWEKIK